MPTVWSMVQIWWRTASFLISQAVIRDLEGTFRPSAAVAQSPFHILHLPSGFHDSANGVLLHLLNEFRDVQSLVRVQGVT